VKTKRLITAVFAAALLTAPAAFAAPDASTKADASKPAAVAAPTGGGTASGPASAAPASKTVTASPNQPTMADPSTAQPVAGNANQPTKEVGVVKTGLKYLVEGLFALVLTLLSGLVTVLMRKFGLESQSKRVNELLEHAVNFAKQKAIGAMKAEGKLTPNAEKMKTAIEYAQKMARDFKLKDKGSAWWEDRLESWIGKRKSEREKEGTAKDSDLNPQKQPEATGGGVATDPVPAPA